MKEIKTCKLGLWNETVPGIVFDKNGICNYAAIQNQLMKSYPRGERGLKEWNSIVGNVKKTGKGKKYDCIIGISGGVDSSYLLYLAKEVYGLRPLAVALDNGWSSDIAIKNIKLITDKLAVDLETYVLDYEEIKDLIRSYMFASLPWIDTPTDTAIKGLMYKIAYKEKIKYIFRGNDFRTEGKQPREWTYSDDKQIKYIHKKYGRIKKLRSFPFLPFWKIALSTFVLGIKDIRPYYYLDYSKAEARSFLENNFGWKYYGGHHHENVFTKFVMSYWLPEKFEIDKRIINLSAQILSGYITRKEGLAELLKPAIEENEKNSLRYYVSKKLDFSPEEFDNLFVLNNKSYRDYPNYEKILMYAVKFMKPLLKLFYSQKPMTFVEMEINQNDK